MADREFSDTLKATEEQYRQMSPHIQADITVGPAGDGLPSLPAGTLERMALLHATQVAVHVLEQAHDDSPDGDWRAFIEKPIDDQVEEITENIGLVGAPTAYATRFRERLRESLCGAGHGDSRATGQQF